MAIVSDYADLLVATGDYVGRNDFSQVFSRLVAMAENKLNRALRVGDMEDSATVTMTDGVGPLPADFLEARDVRIANRTALRSKPLQWLNDRALCGYPLGYAVVGSNLHFGVSWSGSVDLDYYAAIPSLTPDNPTNWLLSKSSAYLYAVAEQVAIWSRDAEKAQAAAALLQSELSDLRIADERVRFANACFAIGGLTP